MTEQTSTLYAKLLGETAVISWAELQPFFARGALLQVDAALDLVEVAEALAGDDREKVAAWLSGGGLSKVGRTRPRTSSNATRPSGRWWWRPGWSFRNARKKRRCTDPGRFSFARPWLD